LGIQDAKIVHVNSWLKTGRSPEWLTCVKQGKKMTGFMTDLFQNCCLFKKARLCELSRRLSFLRRTFLKTLFCTFAAKTWQAANDHHGCTLISTAPRHHVATRALKIQIKICVWSIHVKDFACNFLAD